MKLAILTPSRGRPKELYRFFDSINSTISGQNEIMFYIGIDKDDPSREDYFDILHRMLKDKRDQITIIMIEDDLKPISKIWNELSRLRSWENSADYFMMGGDDFVFVTQEWDIILEEKILSADHPFYLYWFDDNINGENLCTFPIVSKYWISALGYFVPTIFKYFYIDTWVFDIATRARLLKYIPEVKTKHLHFTTSKDIPYDKTYQENRVGNINAEDMKLFRDTEKNRIGTVEMIQERIKNYKRNK